MHAHRQWYNDRAPGAINQREMMMPARPGAFDIWLEREERRREQRECGRRQILDQILTWLDQHAAEYGITEVAVFGSVTTPYRFGPHSDVDLALFMPHGQTLSRFASAIEHAISRDVDVVPLEECRFAPKLIEEALWWTQSR